MTEPTETTVATIEEGEVTGAQIQLLANKLGVILLGEPTPVAIAALLALAILYIRNGQFQGDDLGLAIQDVGEYISTLTLDKQLIVGN